MFQINNLHAIVAETPILNCVSLAVNAGAAPEGSGTPDQVRGDEEWSVG